MKYYKVLDLIKSLGRLNGNLCSEINDFAEELSCEDCVIGKTRKKYKLINICHGLQILEKDLNSYYNVREEKLRKLLESI